jgi:hypothetical protein
MVFDGRPAQLVLAFRRATGSTEWEFPMRVLHHGFLVWAASLCLLSAGLAPSAAAAQPHSHSPDEVLVLFHPGTPGLARRAAHAQAGGAPGRTLAGIDVVVVDVPAGSALERAALYQGNPNVVFAEPNGIPPLVIRAKAVSWAGDSCLKSSGTCTTRGRAF